MADYTTNDNAILLSEEDIALLDSLVLEGVSSKTIKKTFGKGSDYIELHIYNQDNTLVYSEENFTDYIIPTTVEHPTKTSTLDINPEQILNKRGFFAGEYIILLNVLKKQIISTKRFNFSIKEISNDRREIKAISPNSKNSTLGPSVSSFISDIESSVYFKEFSLNFGENSLVPAINILLNKGPDKYEVLFKTLRPLPVTITPGSKFRVVEEISDPITVSVNLGNVEGALGGTPIAGPNFHVDVRHKSSVPSQFSSYDEILQYSVTSSYQHLLNKLENNTLDLNIDYSYIRPVSKSIQHADSTDIPYHFENFVHFSSASERLKNFKYKLKLIEQYDKNLDLLENVSSPSTATTNNKNEVDKKKRNLIKGFDGYEHFLYFESGTFSWPKTNSSKPYVQAHTTSSQALTWFGDTNSDNTNYFGGQVLSASRFDDINPHNLNQLVPEHIKDNTTNNLYVSFVNMVGHHFDHIWTHIKALSDQYNTDNIRGISKDLVYYQLQNFGIEAFDQFENAPLSEYLIGENTSGSNLYGGGHYFLSSSNGSGLGLIVSSSETVVTASNQSIPKGDITKEIWKRIYHNAPYLLKTKGTERGIKALMSCYGVPSTILNIKEYGGSTVTSGPYKDLDLSDNYKTFSYEKQSLALKGTAGTGGCFIKTPWSSSLTDALSSSAKTVEFRIKPLRSTSQYHLFGLSGSTPGTDPHLVLTPYAGNDISASGDSTQYGKLDLHIAGLLAASTPKFPVYNGEFWNIFIGTEGNSGSNSAVKFGAYQSNFNKNVHHYEGSATISQGFRQTSWGDPYYQNNNIGGAVYAYFGGVDANPHANYNNFDGLEYSGSLQEIRYHFHQSASYNMLSHHTLKKHAREPFMYAGNHVSSSYKELILRLPLGSNNKEVTSSFHPNENVTYLSEISSSTNAQEWESIVETHHLPTPDTVGASMTSENVRIDEGTISDDILSPFIKSETSTLDRQPQDFEDLGIFFSPTNELNEDIVYTLGSFRMDDYIGSPLLSAQSSSYYPDLKSLKDLYFKKVNRRYNYWDYVKQIQYIDHTLFKMIEQFVPARANTKTGLLIEPHFLERTKLKRALPKRSDAQTMTEGLHQTFEGAVDGKIYTMRSSSAKDFGQEGINDNIKGQHDPGSYVIAHNNLSFITSSRGDRKELGTNATIDIYDEYINPSLKDPNRENAQFCQAPIKPYDPTIGKPANYVAHKSSVILGNMIGGRISNRYYKYKEYSLHTSSLYING